MVYSKMDKMVFETQNRAEIRKFRVGHDALGLDGNVADL